MAVGVAPRMRAQSTWPTKTVTQTFMLWLRHHDDGDLMQGAEGIKASSDRRRAVPTNTRNRGMEIESTAKRL